MLMNNLTWEEGIAQKWTVTEAPFEPQHFHKRCPERSSGNGRQAGHPSYTHFRPNISTISEPWLVQRSRQPLVVKRLPVRIRARTLKKKFLKT